MVIGFCVVDLYNNWSEGNIMIIMDSVKGGISIVCLRVIGEKLEEMNC